MNRAALQRPDIQGLRAVAVLLVILGHAGAKGFSAGYIGVDIFFVISGFVITQLLLRQQGQRLGHNLLTFYIRRILRIAPAASVLLIVTPVAAYFLLGEFFDTALLSDVRWASLFSANFRLMKTSSDYFSAGVDPSLVTHFWSLAVEEQFYFFYPLLVFVIMRFAPEHSRNRILMGVLGALVALSSLWCIVATSHNGVLAYYSPLTRFWQLAFGGILALVPAVTAEVRPTSAAVAGLTAFAGLALALTFLPGQHDYPGVTAWLPTLISGALLWSGQTQHSIGTKLLLSWKPLVVIGDLSYSLYLWHFMWIHLPDMMPNPPQLPLGHTLPVLGAFVCAAISYYVLENPIRHSRRLSSDPLATLALLGLSIAAVWDATLWIEKLSLSQ